MTSCPRVLSRVQIGFPYSSALLHKYGQKPKDDNSCDAKLKPVSALQPVYMWSCSTGQTETLALDFVDTAVIDIFSDVSLKWDLIGPHESTNLLKTVSLKIM